MAMEEFKRKLSAILSADVAGYSGPLGAHEDETFRTLKAYREVVGILISERRGRVIDSPKDNLLVRTFCPAIPRKHQISAVVGSSTNLTSEIRFAGNPPFCACSRTASSFGAI